ncbi:MAG TPA: GNAT family N-acetyltransferase [Pelolinea sp.]|nr:GNAT family N-acetyltransferase [Pelolinea sp.]
MDEITFRAATEEDSDQGADLIMETLHEFGVYLFGFGDRHRAVSALEIFFSYPGNRFSHQYAEFALSGGEIVGILMLFNLGQMRKSMWATALQMCKVYKLRELVKFLELMLPYRDEENIPADELYIGHLAVKPKYRRHGNGLKLLEYAERRARAQGLPKLSLLTEIENSAARALYEKFGFKVTDTILMPAQMAHVGSKGDVRMVKILSNKN